MDVRYWRKTPPVSQITVYTIIAGDDDPQSQGKEKILLFPQNRKNEPLSLGNLNASIEPKALKDSLVSAKLGNYVQPLIDRAVVPLVMQSLGKQLSASAIGIDPSETTFLCVPSGGAPKQRTFHLKIGCVIPIAFLPFPLNVWMNSVDELHWVRISNILDGYRLDGGEDEEFLAKTALRAYLRD
ncbi:MAG TPA: hypothetical protein P5080_03320 [Candidatus Paceibacterota bacterium]|nr:hypothetical protein [Candidatus Pacearchaeota archaeon]HRZ50998.1 hypothetical protein [Candidatus Paceibacterota bacterium]HSA36719.1 hypothetical protein [Candidatus Paceibacterota bacterium]